MIKTGIYCAEDLKNLQSFKGLLGGRRLPSITLYEDSLKLEWGEVLAEEILERFSDQSRTFKRTYANRFEGFDREAIRAISDAFPAETVMKVHDVGVSDGRTACDFFDLIRGRFNNFEYYASDLRNKFSVVEEQGSKAVFDSDGTLLEVVAPPFVYNIHKPENFLLYPINYIHRAITMFRVVPRLRANFRSGKNTKILLLVCARARELAAKDQRFRLIQHDLLQPMRDQEKFSIVRAMNVLNQTYFTETQMRSIVQHIVASLADGGLFITGSNQGPGSSVQGAIYRRTGEKLSLLWASAKGVPDVHGATI